MQAPVPSGSGSWTSAHLLEVHRWVPLLGGVAEEEEEEESLFKADAEEEGLFKADATRSRRQDKDHGTIESGPRLPVRHRLLTPYGHSGGENWARCTACNEGHDGARSTRQMARVAPAAQLR